MAKPREFKRTCQRCGTEWYVPRELAKMRAPNRLQMAGAKIGVVGSSVSLFGLLRGGRPSRRTQAEVDRLEARRDRVLEVARCPSCGSVSYAEEPA